MSIPESKFDDIRPFNDSEIPAAMERLAQDPLLKDVADFLYPDKTLCEVKEFLLSLRTTEDFQMQVMHRAIKKIVAASNSSCTINGLEKLDKKRRYMFVSNHRDIMLDSAILQVGLVDSGFPTTEITFGSNLMKPEFVVDFGKSNKMFRVERGASMREFLLHSKHLSEYIRHTITSKGESIWIAQRNGRTKNGCDATDQGIIKMFAMSGPHGATVAEKIRELNIVPMVISYQIEPCDALKTREIYLSQKGPYNKAADEDLNSIITGIKQPKGGIVINILDPLNYSLNGAQDVVNNDEYRAVASLLDKHIHMNYHLFDTNFIAWDILNDSARFSDRYTVHAKQLFADDMRRKLAGIEGDKTRLEEIFLEIYANPVVNRLKYSDLV